jgi:hypothetical protein
MQTSPIILPQQLLGEFPAYAGAEQLVDRLSDRGFALEHTRIVGTGLHSVEYVSGRFTTQSALRAGAASGAWFGLFVGLVMGMFDSGSWWLSTTLVTTLIGAVWGGSFAMVAHRATRGRRDFTSVQRLEADLYSVYVDASRADDAIRLNGPC